MTKESLAPCGLFQYWIYSCWNAGTGRRFQRFGSTTGVACGRFLGEGCILGNRWRVTDKLTVWLSIFLPSACISPGGSKPPSSCRRERFYLICSVPRTCGRSASSVTYNAGIEHCGNRDGPSGKRGPTRRVLPGYSCSSNDFVRKVSISRSDPSEGVEMT